jgi:uncharacterized damage-inducible protein DinB
MLAAMNPTDPYPLLARFNRWVNRRYYALLAALADAERKRDRRAFFGSIHNTLNHLLVVDQLWLDRLQGRSNEIRALNQVLYEDFDALRAARERMDERIIRYVEGLDAAALARSLRYEFISGAAAETPLHLLLVTLFNHQTHHRGQIHALMTQAGLKPPDSDVIDYLDEGGS